MNESGSDFQLPVQANQLHSMNTQVLVNIWQASETSFRKSRPLNLWQWCCDS